MKGNLLVAHGGGPTAVINSSLYGVIRAAQASAGVGRILAARHGIEGVLQDDLIDLAGESEGAIEGLTRTPASAIGSCRRKLQDGDFDRIFEVLEAHGVRYFLYNGGNDSMDTAHKMHTRARRAGAELYVAGIPKTIDNDLARTDFAPGFPSAARCFASLVRDTGFDVRALPTPVSVFEVMGRNAGWLAAATVAARERPDDAPHRVYVPEQRLDRDRFLADVEGLVARQGWAVIAVSEGARNERGEALAEGKGAAVDGFGHALPGDVGATLAGWITRELGLRARSEKPGLPGRGSIVLRSRVDVEQAIAVGRAAVAHVTSGRSGDMLAIRRTADTPYAADVVPVPLEDVANVEHVLPAKYLAGDGLIDDTFLDYLRPLLGDPLPEYARLAGRPAS